MHTLHLREFRGFDNFEIEFKPGVNLLVGDNASGKTTVLKATKYALSSFFSGFSDDNTSWQAPGNEDFRRHISDD